MATTKHYVWDDGSDKLGISITSLGDLVCVQSECEFQDAHVSIATTGKHQVYMPMKRSDLLEIINVLTKVYEGSA